MIRRAQPADTEAIRALIVQLDYEPPDGLEEKIRRLSNHPDEVLLVFELDAEVVAFLCLHFIPQIAREWRFCAHQLLRGERYRARSWGRPAA